MADEYEEYEYEEAKNVKEWNMKESYSLAASCGAQAFIQDRDKDNSQWYVLSLTDIYTNF